MNIQDQIKVMQAFAQGESIEIYDNFSQKWLEHPAPTWDWNNHEYRVQPKKENILHNHTPETLLGKIAIFKNDNLSCLIVSADSELRMIGVGTFTYSRKEFLNTIERIVDVAKFQSFKNLPEPPQSPETIRYS